MSTIRYVLKHRSWPSRLQRDFMSRNPRRQARVRAVADAINAQVDAEDRLPNGLQREFHWRLDRSEQLKLNIGGH